MFYLSVRSSKLEVAMELSKLAWAWAEEQWNLGKIDAEHKCDAISIAEYAYEEGIKAGLAMKEAHGTHSQK
jgi:hypothetical protein